MSNKNSVCVFVCVCERRRQRERQKKNNHETRVGPRGKKMLVFPLCLSSYLVINTYVHNHKHTLPSCSLPTHPWVGGRWSMVKTRPLGCELLQRGLTNQWLIASPALGETDWRGWGGGGGGQVNDGEMRRQKTKVEKGRHWGGRKWEWE